jgi:hypothetical protein
LWKKRGQIRHLFFHAAPIFHDLLLQKLSIETNGGRLAHGGSGGTPLPFAAATALLIGITVVLAAIAARTTVRRDIA